MITVITALMIAFTFKIYLQLLADSITSILCQLLH